MSVANRCYAAMAQVVERILGKDEVGSSSLPSSSKAKILSRSAARFSLYVFITQYQ